MNTDRWYYDYDDEEYLWTPAWKGVFKHIVARGSGKSGQYLDGLEAWFSGEEKLFEYITVINDVEKDSAKFPESYPKGDINLLIGTTE